MQRIARRITTATLLALAIYSGAVGAIALIGFQDHATPADIIVVPGNTVQPDGTVSARLQSRLDVALQLFHEGLAPTIFVSGGTGREGRDEAAAMAAYLVAQGVAPNAIIQDPQGVDTKATAVNAAQYLRAHQLHSAIVATQYFHVARTTLALERSGVRVAGTRHARYFELRDAYSLFREVLGYAAYWARE